MKIAEKFFVQSSSSDQDSDTEKEEISLKKRTLSRSSNSRKKLKRNLRKDPAPPQIIEISSSDENEIIEVKQRPNMSRRSIRNSKSRCYTENSAILS